MTVRFCCGKNRGVTPFLQFLSDASYRVVPNTYGQLDHFNISQMRFIIQIVRVPLPSPFRARTMRHYVEMMHFTSRANQSLHSLLTIKRSLPLKVSIAFEPLLSSRCVSGLALSRACCFGGFMLSPTSACIAEPLGKPPRLESNKCR
jgi:hypothetical protein